MVIEGEPSEGKPGVVEDEPYPSATGGRDRSGTVGRCDPGCLQETVRELKRELCEVRGRLYKVRPHIDRKCLKSMENVFESIMNILERSASVDSNAGTLQILPSILAILDTVNLPFDKFDQYREQLCKAISGGRVSSGLKGLVGTEFLTYDLASTIPLASQHRLNEILMELNAPADLKYVAYATNDQGWLDVASWWKKSPLSLRWMVLATGGDAKWLAYSDLYQRSPPDLRWVAVHFGEPRWLHFCHRWRSLDPALIRRAIHCRDYTFLRTDTYDGSRFDLWKCQQPAEEFYLVPVELRNSVATRLANRCCQCALHCGTGHRLDLIELRVLKEELAVLLQQMTQAGKSAAEDESKKTVILTVQLKDAEKESERLRRELKQSEEKARFESNHRLDVEREFKAANEELLSRCRRLETILDDDRALWATRQDQWNKERLRLVSEWRTTTIDVDAAFKNKIQSLLLENAELQEKVTLLQNAVDAISRESEVLKLSLTDANALAKKSTHRLEEQLEDLRTQNNRLHVLVAQADEQRSAAAAQADLKLEIARLQLLVEQQSHIIVRLESDKEEAAKNKQAAKSPLTPKLKDEAAKKPPQVKPELKNLIKDTKKMETVKKTEVVKKPATPAKKPAEPLTKPAELAGKPADIVGEPKTGAPEPKKTAAGPKKAAAEPEPKKAAAEPKKMGEPVKKPAEPPKKPVASPKKLVEVTIPEKAEAVKKAPEPPKMPTESAKKLEPAGKPKPAKKADLSVKTPVQKLTETPKTLPATPKPPDALETAKEPLAKPPLKPVEQPAKRPVPLTTKAPLSKVPAKNVLTVPKPAPKPPPQKGIPIKFTQGVTVHDLAAVAKSSSNTYYKSMVKDMTSNTRNYIAQIADEIKAQKNAEAA